MENFTPTQEKQPVTLEFIASPTSEAERVSYTLKKLNWFLENGYRPRLPEGVSSEEADMEKITAAISQEFNEALYAEKQKEVTEAWESAREKFMQNLEKLGLPVPQNYIITLTRYGVSGSYGLPNQVILNIERTTPLIRTVFHEMIHLAIENLIQKYTIEHWTKERLVNLTYNEFFPEHASLQEDPPHAEIVQALFSKHFPDMRKIIEEISEETTKRSEKK